MGRRRKTWIDYCTAEGCDKPVQAKGLCWKHYQDMRRHGELRPFTVRVQNEGKECAAPGCTREAKALGYCKRHWNQINRHGRLTPERERGRPAKRARRPPSG